MTDRDAKRESEVGHRSPSARRCDGKVQVRVRIGTHTH